MRATNAGHAPLPTISKKQVPNDRFLVSQRVALDSTHAARFATACDPHWARTERSQRDDRHRCRHILQALTLRMHGIDQSIRIAGAKDRHMDEDDDLEVIELGDAKLLTKGHLIPPLAEDNPVAPYRPPA